MHIRRATRDDYDEVVDLLIRGGYVWESYAFYLGYAHSTPFVVEGGSGVIVGTGMATRHGTSGWLGQILVDPGARGRT